MDDNDYAVITGASGGIGRDLAEVFAARGVNLILVARKRDILENAAAQISQKFGVKAMVIEKDLTLANAPAEIFDQVKDLQVEYLVNNAGFGDFGLFCNTDLKKELDIISLNITALTVLTKYFVKEMTARGHGRILNLGSNGSFFSCPLMAVYCATKNYVLAFSEALSVELAKTGVTVTCLCPGPTASGFQKAANNENSKLVKGKRLPTSREVAQFGYRAMMKGKMTAIHGVNTRFEIFLRRLAPRKLSAKLVMYRMKE